LPDGEAPDLVAQLGRAYFDLSRELILTDRRVNLQDSLFEFGFYAFGV
jgi:hypothetical protein